MNANKLLIVSALCVIGGLAWYGSDQIAQKDSMLETEKKSTISAKAEIERLKSTLTEKEVELDVCKTHNTKLVAEVAAMTKYIESKAEVDDALQRLNRIAEKEVPSPIQKADAASDSLPPGMERLGSGNEIKIK